MARLSVLTHIPVAALSRIAEALPEVELTFVPQEGEVPPDLHGEVLLTLAWGSPNLAEVVKRGVRWIHTVGTGIDGFPLDQVGDRILSCARGGSAVPIAEWTLAMLLAFEKRLPESWVSKPPESWNRADLGGIRGKTLGLIGLGAIALATAERALPFGMRVRACRRSDAPSPRPEIELVSYEELLASSDHLVVAAPSTQATRHLLDAAAFAKIKPGVHLVNISRGKLVDQDALRAALDDGRVARASLDVCFPEPLPEGHWLYGHPSVRLSPHISWSMPGAVPLLFDTFLENLRRYLAGQPLEGIVDLDEGY